MFLHPDLFQPKALLAALLLSAMGFAGCAGAVAVTPDVAGTAMEKSYGLFRMGKAESHQVVALDDMIAKTRRAAEELDLTLVREEKHPDQLKMVYRDGRKLDITITLVRRTRTATEMHVDVGLLGDAGMGQLVMAQMLRQLEHPVGITTTPTTAGS
jgi:hypothetical protein